jgi:RNA polymerase sigma-70 factor (ECF subfamily)
MERAPGSATGPGAALPPERLLALLYDELRDIARHHMRGERPDHTLAPTALVHEAWLRLSGTGPFTSRAHFLRAASRAMRHVLVDHARARGAAKRDAGVRVTFVDGLAGDAVSLTDVLTIDAALTELAAAEPRWAEVVELRFFAGLEVEEVAALLDLSPATVKRDWRFARAWLAHRLEAPPPPDGHAAG